MNDPNLGFIIAAYALGFVVIAGMIGAVLLDRMNLQRALAKLSRNATNESET
jgi:heme exporter protein CcmD